MYICETLNNHFINIAEKIETYTSPPDYEKLKLFVNGRNPNKEKNCNSGDD